MDGGIKLLLLLILYDFILENTKQPKLANFEYNINLHGDDYIPLDDYRNSSIPHNESECKNKN